MGDPNESKVMPALKEKQQKLKHNYGKIFLMGHGRDALVSEPLIAMDAIVAHRKRN